MPISLTVSSASERHTLPPWLLDLLGLQDRPAEGEQVRIRGRAFVNQDGILRQQALASESQQQTGSAFGFKWHKRDTFDSPASLARMRQWLLERYGDPADMTWFTQREDRPLVLDAGCGASMSGLEYWGPYLDRIRYVGVDISHAVDAARDRFAVRGFTAGFLQADITDLPLPPASVDVIFSEGVLHHTDSTERAIRALAPLLKPDARFMFYVYRRKGPLREFTDDYIRARFQAMTPEQAWKAMEPLTRLGIALGELNTEIEIPEPIELLGIPAGRINVQRLFYWHVAKAFYSPQLTFDEMNHINFDWYAPANAHRQTPEEVRVWCEQAGLAIEREVIEEAGITVIARRKA